MDRNAKYMNYLESLKTDSNKELLESIITGFSTLVEYQVTGDITQRSTDVMTEDLGDEDNRPMGEEDDKEGMEPVPELPKHEVDSEEEVVSDITNVEYGSETGPLDESIIDDVVGLLEGLKSMSTEQVKDAIRHSAWLKKNGHSGLNKDRLYKDRMAAQAAFHMIEELDKSRGKDTFTDTIKVDDEPVLEGIEVDSFATFCESYESSDDVLVENVNIPLTDDQLEKIYKAVQAYKVKQNAEIEASNVPSDSKMIQAYLEKIGLDLWSKAMNKMGIDNPSPELIQAAKNKAQIISN